MTNQVRYTLFENPTPRGKFRFTIRGRRPKGVFGIHPATGEKIPAQVNASFTQKGNETRDEVKARAEHRIDELLDEDFKYARNMNQWITPLSREQLDSCELAHQVMAEKGVDATIYEMVERGIKTWKPTGKPAILSKCVLLFAAYRERMNYYDQVTGPESSYKSVLNRLILFVGRDCDLNKLMSQDISDFMESKHFKDERQYQSCILLSAFFSFLIKRPDQKKDSRMPLMFDNPAQETAVEMKKIYQVHKRPRVWTLEEVRKAFEVAETYENGEGAIYLALTVFGGIRPHVRRGEITGVKPQHHVNKHIRVSPEFKTGFRNVDVSPNLAKWIEAYGLKNVVPKWTEGKWRKFRKLCNWSHDVTRHTCISYWLQAHAKQEDRAKYMFGNSDRIRNQHYRDAVTDEDAAEFWNIVPRMARGQVIEFEKEA